MSNTIVSQSSRQDKLSFQTFTRKAKEYALAMDAERVTVENDAEKGQYSARIQAGGITTRLFARPSSLSIYAVIGSGRAKRTVYFSA